MIDPDGGPQTEALPHTEAPKEPPACAAEDGPILSFHDVRIDYRVREGMVKPVDGVTLNVERGRVTALIGESGSGKSTLTGAILRILAPNGRISPESRILFEGRDILKMSDGEVRAFRWHKASMVFQAAQNALNPTLRIEEQLTDTAMDHGVDVGDGAFRDHLMKLLARVRLEPERVLGAYPHQLSGGMRQRVIIAMALVLQPRLIILDEPTTALDVITQSYIFDILREIHDETGLTMLFITHDMPAVARLADVTGVMYAGKIFETAPSGELFGNPLHPYTAGLLNSIPSIRGDIVKRVPIPGQPPDLIDKPAGCVFHPRCPVAKLICTTEEPKFVEAGPGHFLACHRGGACL
jgi:peptide/nickel transport system ATP-binding protein